MTTPENPSDLPPQYTAPEGLPDFRKEGLVDMLRCIACVIGRADEGALLSAPAIQTCSGRDSNMTFALLRGMQEANLLEPFTPEGVTKPITGRWGFSQIRYLRPTELGLALLPAKPQEDCKMRNPLARLTPTQEKVLNCIRCILSKTENTEEPTKGGVLMGQVVDCQKRAVRSVEGVFYKLLDNNLLERKDMQNVVWGKGKRPTLHVVTPEGAPWITPQAAKDCPTLRLELPSKKLSTNQQKILGCMACLHRAKNPDGTTDPIRSITVSRCQNIEVRTVGANVAKLLEEGYLEKVAFPGAKKTDYYKVTPAGDHFLASVQISEGCPSGKIPPEQSIVVAPDPEEVRELMRHRPGEIVKRFPVTTFENGAQLLDTLDKTYYGGTTMLELVMQAITSTLRKRLPRHSPSEPSDIAQEVLTAFATREGPVSFPTEGMTLMYGIVRHKVADVFRKLSRNKETEYLDVLEKPETISSQDGDFESDLVSRMSARQIVKELIRNIKLSPLELSIISAMAFGPAENGSTDEKIAARHDTTASNVRLRRFRLIKRLHQNPELRSKWEE